MKTSLKDIAKRTNLSISTVSRVLNGKAEQFRISKESQQIVFQAAEELNYIPNLTAVNLKSGKTQTIALIVPSLVNPFFAQIAGQIAHAVQRKGYVTLISDSNESLKTEQEEIKQIISRNVDGILIASAGRNGKHIEEIKNRGIPVVCLDRYFDDLDIPCIATDNFWGGYMATKHLIEHGHTHISCIQGLRHSMPNIQRVEGYKKAMKDLLGKEEYFISGSDFNVQNGYAETLKLLRKKKRPTAIFTLSNTIALGCLKALKEQNIHVPNDISLITFDDHPYLDFLSTPLTCVSQPFDEICIGAIRLLFAEINKEATETKRIFLRPEMVFRDSIHQINASNGGHT